MNEEGGEATNGSSQNRVHEGDSAVWGWLVDETIGVQGSSDVEQPEEELNEGTKSNIGDVRVSEVVEVAVVELVLSWLQHQGDHQGCSSSAEMYGWWPSNIDELL